MADRFEVRVLDDLASLRRDEPLWTEAVQKANDRLHTSAGFLDAWCNSFRQTHSLALVLVLRGGRPIAALPLLFLAKRLGPFRLPYCRLLGNDFSPRSDIGIVECETEVFTALEELLRQRGILWFDCGWTPSATAARVQAQLSRFGWTADLRRQYDLPVVRLHGSWADWLGAKSRVFRKSLRAAAHRSRAFKCKTFLGRGIDAECVIAHIEHVNRSSWSHDAGSSFVDSPSEREFMRTLLRAYSELGLVLAAVLVDESDCAAAFAIGIRIDDRVYGLKTGYRSDLASASLGTEVMARFVELCSLSGADSVDMDCITTRGDYKRRWATVIDVCESWRLFAPRRTSRVIAFCYRAWRRMRSRSSHSRRRDESDTTTAA